METPDTPPTSRFPTARRIRRAVFSRKMAYALIILVTFIALLYAEENFRGGRAWERYRKEAEGRGVKLSFADHIPPPIPDAENGANTPWIQSWFPKPFDQDDWWPPIKSLAENKISSRKPDGRRHLTDLVAWQEAFQATGQDDKKSSKRKINETDRETAERAAAAKAVLAALEVYQPTLDALRAASAKPRIRYPVYYNLEEPFTILLPHLAKIKSTVSLLDLKSSAALAADQPEDAFKDVELMLWLTESLREEPFLINQLVRIACLRISARSIWEGIAQHKWTEAQLQALQTRLAQIDFLSSLAMSMGAERAGSITTIEQVRKRKNLAQLFEVNSEGGIPERASFVSSVVPRGWYYMEAVNYCRAMDMQLQNGIDLPGQIIHGPQISANHERVEKFLSGGVPVVLRHRLFAKLLLPALHNAARKFASGQVTAHEAVLACALERSRLANGKLPETLEALAPKFIARVPHDPLTGEPLKYERLNGTDFVLSSVGWPENQTANGTAPGKKSKMVEWIWHSAAP